MPQAHVSGRGPSPESQVETAEVENPVVAWLRSGRRKRRLAAGLQLDLPLSAQRRARVSSDGDADGVVEVTASGGWQLRG
ncbi:MAG: hypothetical protein ABIJ09_00830 [Pseudomonadota bacterium]